MADPNSDFRDLIETKLNHLSTQLELIRGQWETTVTKELLEAKLQVVNAQMQHQAERIQVLEESRTTGTRTWVSTGLAAVGIIASILIGLAALLTQ